MFPQFIQKFLFGFFSTSSKQILQTSPSLSPFSLIEQYISRMNLVRDTFVTELQIFERVLARWIVEKRIRSNHFACLVMSALAFDLLKCIFWVGLTWFVCNEAYRSFRAELVFFSSPESAVYFDGFILFALEPRLLSFANIRAVLTKL